MILLESERLTLVTSTGDEVVVRAVIEALIEAVIEALIEAVLEAVVEATFPTRTEAWRDFEAARKEVSERHFASHADHVFW